MDLPALKKKYGKAVAKMDVAAPVDLEFMFHAGVIELKTIDDKKARLADERGVYVAGDVTCDSLTLEGQALFVAGNVTVKTLRLEGTVVVMGDLTANEVRGTGEPFTLTVMGKSTISLAVMEHEYIMQFLGTGHVKRLIDTEGGADELVELWQEAGSKVTVQNASDEEE